MTDKTPAMPELPEPELGYIETDKSRQPAFSAAQMRAALQSAPPAAAGVSDVIAMVRERYRGTKWGKAAECICDAVDEAILAQRQQAVPMTDEQRALIIGRAADKTADRSAAALYAICETERLYGITAQGAQEGV